MDNTYEIILDALMKAGHSQEESEQIICDLIEEQSKFTAIADNLHNLINEKVD